MGPIALIVGLALLGSQRVQAGWYGLEGLGWPSAPALQLSGSSNTLEVSWPAYDSRVLLDGAYFHLETATTADPLAVWSPVALPKERLGTNIVVSIPLTDTQQFFRLRAPSLVPLFGFAVFYNSLLEFPICPAWTFGSVVHANGDIYVGSSRPLTFNSTVTASGTISAPAWAGWTTSSYGPAPVYNSSPGKVTGVSPLELPVGTSNTAATLRELISMPPPEGDTNPAIAQLRYCNKAQILLLVSNSAVNARIQCAPNDPAPATITATWNPTNTAATNFTAIASSFPFLSITNGASSDCSLTFYDQREKKWIRPAQIDIGRLATWLATNAVITNKFRSGSGVVPNIMYIADNRTAQAANQLAAVRLINAADAFPTNPVPAGQPTGFTLATPNPLYVLGNYNTPGGNTSNRFPASLVSDALTVLSVNWKDNYSTNAIPFTSGSDSRKLAVSTTINAAILTGIVYSTGTNGSNYSGGLHNLPRLLEDWGNGSSGIVLTLNSSIVCLFDSARATNQYQFPPSYYFAPGRTFHFDTTFTDPARLPPGTPYVVLR